MFRYFQVTRIQDTRSGSSESRSPESRSPGSRSPESRSPRSRSPGSRSPGSRSPGSRSPGQDHPNPGHPNPGHPDPGHPDPGHPDPGHPDPGHPDLGHPDPGHPDPGHPDPGHPDSGHPDPGHPDSGHPDPGHRVRATRIQVTRIQDPGPSTSRSPGHLLWVPEKKYPNYRHQFEMLPNFGYYELNAMIIICVIMIIIGCIQSTLTVSILAFQMYQALVVCSVNLSKTTLEKHKAALKSLVCQFLTTPIAILPAMLIVSTLFVPFSGAQLFTQYMLAVMTTHSTINCLVIIFTIPEFRAFVMFWSKEGKLQRHRKSVSFVIANSNGSTRPFRISNRRSVF
ncbi:unnamed protein product [Caenorhabditis nigoni]